MGADVHALLEKLAKELAEEKVKAAAEIAGYRTQNDFNNELCDYVADVTGHKHLATTCFVEVSIESGIDLKVEAFTDSEYSLKVFKSNSSFHQGGGKWRSIKSHYTMSSDDFWERKILGDEPSRQYGALDMDWVTDNFWDGIVYSTNGWPLGKADYLAVYKDREIPARAAVASYVDKYIADDRYPKYILDELNK